MRGVEVFAYVTAVIALWIGLLYEVQMTTETFQVQSAAAAAATAAVTQAQVEAAIDAKLQTYDKTVDEKIKTADQKAVERTNDLASWTAVTTASR